MNEVEGKLAYLTISIFINSGTTYSYINANVIEGYCLVSKKFPRHRMV